MEVTNGKLSKQAYKEVKQMIRAKKLLPSQNIFQEQLADKLDRKKYRKLMQEEKHMDLIRLVRKKIYRL